ncbi:MAG TPA: PilZ domain-containing protein, partial [Clostridia bacterium]
MSITDISNDEFFDVLKRTNLVRVRIDGSENWCVAPVLYAGDGVISLLVDCGHNISGMGNGVTLKFQKNDYEYIVFGRIIESGVSLPISLIITPLSVHRYCNIRKHIRYDTDLHARVFDECGADTDCIVKNISRGGVMLLSKTKISQSNVKVKIFFKSGNSISANARFARETEANGEYVYGIGFIEIDEKDRIILNAEIGSLEGEYLKSLNFLKEYINKGAVIDTEVAVLCTSDGSMDIRESLTKMGAENFD